MASTASIGGIHRGGVLSAGINSSLRPKQQRAVKSVRVNMAYSQRASASSVSCSASLYQVLSVPHDANARDLKTAYRRMALKYHPDVCPPEEKEECSRMFIELREAYETLSDPVRREDYDWRVQNKIDLSESVGNSGMNSSAWEAQIVELLRGSNCRRENTWGGRMRNRNQQRDAAASSR